MTLKGVASVAEAATGAPVTVVGRIEPLKEGLTLVSADG